MGIEEIVSWYQKKIGTYDKQQWENTIEQRILHSTTFIPLKTTKPKTEFIDLDLVRGSSFPKAKPKHGLVTVTRLAILRLFLLPFYSAWWIKQTSIKVFALLSILYSLQVSNIVIYYLYTRFDVTSSSNEHVSSSEIIIPLSMMLILSIIHSQIVATHPGPKMPPNKTKIRRQKRVRRRVHFNNARSRNSLSDLNNKSSESSIDSQNILPDDKKPSSSSQYGIRKRYVMFGQVSRPLLENRESMKCVNVQFHVDENIENVENVEKLENNVPNKEEDEKTIDDGFESFNGNGSSENGDENVKDKRDLNALNESETNKSTKSSNDSISSSYKSTKSNDSENRKSTADYSSGGQESDTESDDKENVRLPSLSSRRGSKLSLRTKNAQNAESSCESDDERPDINSSEHAINCPKTVSSTSTQSAEYIGVTTNSEECSYSSEYDESDSQTENNNYHIVSDYNWAPTAILSPSCSASDRVSCTIWDNREIKKADLSVLDISSAIIARVETMPETLDYFYIGVVFSVMLSVLPALCRLSKTATKTVKGELQLSVAEFIILVFDKLSVSSTALLDAALGPSDWEQAVAIIALIQRCALALLFFFLLAVAERTFKQRFLYAKFFSHLTSSRRARKSDLPHFRLNKVRNIKTWLSVRSYLKRRGPQRSVDVIVSAAFIITLLLLSFISMELLKNSVTLHSQYNIEAVIWCLGLGIFLLRFMTLGTQINRKNRNLSVLITEQINLYLQIEQKPHKKDELMVANSVLKLAADLLKELESPFKISGLSANPYLYNITKLVILSALSGVLSEILGFKIRLHKIDINK